MLEIKKNSLALYWAGLCVICAAIKFSLGRKKTKVRRALRLKPSTRILCCFTLKEPVDFHYTLSLFASFHHTLKSCTPMQANMNCSSVVTIMMLPMVLMATNTHWTTCCKGHTVTATFSWKTRRTNTAQTHTAPCCDAVILTFRPLALLMALSGRRTLKTRRIFTTEIAEDLRTTEKHTGGFGRAISRACCYGGIPLKSNVHILWQKYSTVAP